MSGWSWRAAAAEAGRALTAGAGFAATFALAGVALVGGALLVDALAVADVARAEREWLEDGGSVAVVRADEGTIRSEACDRLRLLDGVEAAFGATWHAGSAQAAGNEVGVVDVTGGVYGFFGLSEFGLIIDEALSARLPSGELLEVHIDGGTEFLPVASRQSLAILGPEFDSTVLRPSRGTGQVALCFVRFAPQARTLVSSVPALLQAGPSDELVVRQRLASTEYSRDFVAEVTSRTSRYLPPLAGLGLALAWLGLRWQRRRDEALYVMLGVPRSRRVVIGLIQGLLITGASALLGAALAAAVVVLVAGEWRTAALLVVPSGLLAVLGSAWGTISLWSWYSPRAVLTGLKQD